MGKIKYSLVDVQNVIDKNGFKLIEVNGKKLILIDYEGYKYYINNYYRFILHSNPEKFHKSNPYTIENIKLWCKLNNKLFNLLSEIYENNHIKLKWECLKEDCKEVFYMNWNNIKANKGCSFCTGLQVGLSNCLATKNHDLAKEWYTTKNGDLTPYNVTAKTHKKVWWQCSKNPEHIWDAFINNRNKHLSNCPYCSDRLPTIENNLLIDNPILCEEWDYGKNNKKPEEYTSHSSEKVYWICNDCEHKWATRICHRNNGSGCPECNKSKGEKECKIIFLSKGFIEIAQDEYDKLLDIDRHNNTYFIPQKTFEGLVGVGNGLLSYDFYLPKYNLLIEYQGEFHDGTAKIQTEEEFIIQKEHDRRKKEYALEKEYNFLEIWYWDFDNIELILSKELNLLS